MELESHVKEHKAVEKFQANIEKCISNKVCSSFVPFLLFYFNFSLIPYVWESLFSHNHSPFLKYFVSFNVKQNKFQAEELAIYVQHLTTLQKSYNELLVLSNKRLVDLELLQDFIQSATTELIWLNEKEEVEIARDWSAKSLNIAEIERYYEVMSRTL